MQERASLQTSTHDTPASASDFLNLHEIIAKARQNLNQNNWDYIVGGTETETTLRRNRMALDSHRVPAARAARREQGRLLGPHSRPQAAAAGRARSGRHTGELSCRVAPNRSCARSTSSASRICSARSATPASRSSRRRRPMRCASFSSMCAAIRPGSTIMSSAPLPTAMPASASPSTSRIYSRRERDIAKRFVTAGRRRVQGREFQAALDWRTVERIKQRFNIPLAIKGIATAEDARSRWTMGSSGSTSPIMAAGSSIMAAARSRCCRKSSMPSPGARRS